VTRSTRLIAGLVAVLAAPSVSAADEPLQGEFFRLSSRAQPGVARIRLGAVGQAPEQRVRDGADPRVAGATLEVLGDNVLGADAPPVPLPASNWRALGVPPGSRGFRYVDASCRFGVRKAAFRFGTMASLSVTGGGPAWPYRVVGTPSNVLIRFSVGEHVFCASFGPFRRARGGTLVAGHNPPPASCQVDAPIVVAPPDAEL
jgi:hypothetical protein